MIKPKLLALIGFVLFAQACTTPVANNDTVETPIIEDPAFNDVSLNAVDSFQLGNEAVNLWNWKLIDDKVVAQISDENNILLTYSFPEFELLSTHGSRGKGPEEYLAANWGISNDTTVMLYDINKNSLYNLSFQGDNLRLKDTTALYGEIDGYPGVTKPYTMIQRLDDEVYVMKTDDRDSTSLDIINLKTPKILSSYPIIFENRSARTGYPPFDFNITYSDGMLVLGYKYINRIEFYRISDDYELQPILVIGNDEDQSDIPQREWQSYYTHMENDGKYVYLAKQSADNQSTSIDIYTLDGKPVKRAILDKLITNILLDPTTNKLYAHVQLEDMNRVYVYNFDFL